MSKITKKPDGTVFIERFSRIRRMEHTAVVITFVVLVLTGFPQKFNESGWGTALLNIFGGLDTARIVHRVAGFVFAFHALVHILAIVVGFATKKMRMTMLPTSRDFSDVIDTIQYYFGHKKKHPEYSKFDYRQKFEYFGLVLGGLIMILSGFILIYPSISSKIYGQLIPAARLAHSNEALLAFCVLLIWHIYGAVLSPDVFPLDTSIFTGNMSEEELKKHHALEYYRLFPEKRQSDKSDEANM